MTDTDKTALNELSEQQIEDLEKFVEPVVKAYERGNNQDCQRTARVYQRLLTGLAMARRTLAAEAKLKEAEERAGRWRELALTANEDANTPEIKLKEIRGEMRFLSPGGNWLEKTKLGIETLKAENAGLKEDIDRLIMLLKTRGVIVQREPPCDEPEKA